MSVDPATSGFREALMPVIAQALARIVAAVADRSHPAYRTMHVVDFDSPQLEFVMKTALDPDLLLLTEVKGTSATEEPLRGLIAAVSADGPAKVLLEASDGSIGNSANPGLWLEEVLLLPFVRHYLARFGFTAFSEASFDAIFQHVLDALTSETVLLDVVVPLHSFSADA